MDSVLVILPLLAVLIVVFAFISFLDYSIKKKKSSNNKEIQISFGDKKHRFADATYHTKISGITYNNTKFDVGGYFGVIYHDTENEYDKNAIAILTNSGRLVGYIPKNETSKLREWCDRNFLPCVFYIAKGDDAPLYGHVIVIDNDEEGTEEIVIRQVKWFVENFGVSFIPRGIGENFKNINSRSKEEWLEYIDELLSEY